MSNLVLVIDMVIGFMEAGRNLYCGDDARKIIPHIRALIEFEKASGSDIIFIVDTHEPDDLEFEMFPVHCVRGSEECEIIPELANYANVTMPKRRYSAFYDTNLSEQLCELNPENIIICGVCTDICIMHTVSDARNRDYSVIIPTNCIASFDQEAHRYALQHMEKILGAKLTNAIEF